MSRRSQIFNFLLVTAVTVVIWGWTYGATRRPDSLMVDVLLRPADSVQWKVTPALGTMNLSIEGTNRSIEEANRLLLNRPIVLELGINAEGEIASDYITLVRRNARVREAGISILAALLVSDAPRIQKISVHRDVKILRQVPGASAIDVEVDPLAVSVAMTHEAYTAVTTFGQRELTVEPDLSPEELDALETGRRITLEHVQLRVTGLPQGINSNDISITPAHVQLVFTLRSLVRSYRIENPVRIQIVGPPEEQGTVTVEPRQITGVTVEVTSDVFAQISSEKAAIFAVIHLQSIERQERSLDKHISYFIVRREDGTFTYLDARVGEEGDEPPLIHITIGQDETSPTP